MLLDLVTVVVVALLVSAIVCRGMIWIGPIDSAAEQHKKHENPTPTSGGVGIGVGYGAAIVLLNLFSLVWRHSIDEDGQALLLISALFAYPFLLIGFIDDARTLRARFKFAVYWVLAFAAAWALGVASEFRFGDFSLHLPFIIALGGTALWVFTLINAVNFMDGSNGLAMGSVAIGLLFSSAIATAAGEGSVAAMALSCVGALIGFLVWNFPAGRLFAGDSGALFAGAIAAFGGLAITSAGVSALVPPILFFPLLADVLLTLLDRLRRRESLWDGHTKHIYQIAIRSGWSHAKVALAYWAAMVVCGVLAFWAAGDERHIAPALVLAALALAAIALDISVRRTIRHE